MKNKFYCLIRKDLSFEQRAVQGGHALAQYFFKFGIPDNWDNGTLIYLGIENENQLKKWFSKLLDLGMDVSHFIEPDLNNEITAIGAIAPSNDRLFRSLPLLRF